ncbi:hypothetical protein HanXRQr2_Chr12g0561871 [Helianthus annuus]|uniref:Uncharacterized protein n=1 Tax=Helianthus annuus TaxID=4232 RepID=A0A9K3HK13_HELAN|nr:hypothetical protein HanXRQr2_Chr12g0561871 [Helianthus annuus]
MLLNLEQTYLLQTKPSPPSHTPFHFAGIGPKPSSLKLSDSSHIPESMTPTIMSLSIVGRRFSHV